MTNEEDLWQAVIAQQVEDACHVIFDRKYLAAKFQEDDLIVQAKPTGCKPTRIESFEAWQWLYDPRWAEDRETVCLYAGYDSKNLERIFSAPQAYLDEVKECRRWARRVLRS